MVLFGGLEVKRRPLRKTAGGVPMHKNLPLSSLFQRPVLAATLVTAGKGSQDPSFPLHECGTSLILKYPDSFHHAVCV